MPLAPDRKGPQGKIKSGKKGRASKSSVLTARYPFPPGILIQLKNIIPYFDVTYSLKYISMKRIFLVSLPFSFLTAAHSQIKMPAPSPTQKPSNRISDLVL